MQVATKDNKVAMIIRMIKERDEARKKPKRQTRPRLLKLSHARGLAAKSEMIPNFVVVGSHRKDGEEIIAIPCL